MLYDLFKKWLPKKGFMTTRSHPTEIGIRPILSPNTNRTIKDSLKQNGDGDVSKMEESLYEYEYMKVQYSNT